MKGILVVPVSRVAKVLLPQFESEDAFYTITCDVFVLDCIMFIYAIKVR